MLYRQLPNKEPPPPSSPSLVTAFQYRLTVEQGTHENLETPKSEEAPESKVHLTEDIFLQRLAEERAQGSAEAEKRLKLEYEQKLALERARVNESIHSFEQTRKDYFAKVEGEVVQLALSIAKKILHREAQVDPLLVMTLVHIALAQMKDGSAVAVRVRPYEAARWREQFQTSGMNVEVTVIEDSACSAGDCVLETELGSVNFNLDMQLKEVERGFMDVLARTPQLG